MDNTNLLFHLGDLSPCELAQKGLLYFYTNLLLNAVIIGAAQGIIKTHLFLFRVNETSFLLESQNPSSQLPP